MRKKWKGLVLMSIIGFFSSILSGCQVKKPILPKDYQGLTCVEYRKTNGDLGSFYELKLEKNKNGDLLTITTQERLNGKKEVKQIKVSDLAISDLQQMLNKYHPENWSSYPYDKMALDGVSISYILTYNDPLRTYNLTNDKLLPETESDIGFKIYNFLLSYASQIEPTHYLHHKSFDGGGSTIAIEVENPEYVRWFYHVDKQQNTLDTGTPFTQIFSFSGRIPGSTKMKVIESGPLMEEDVITYYLIEVDENFVVTFTLIKE